jgi:glycosyltransferase involved in cell wall biosynthesis
VFSIILATRDSERALVPTLAALVPGATAGIVREVIITDGGSHDRTEDVADIAGCVFHQSAEPLGARLSAAARSARGDWLMFLQPGMVPAFAWIDETIAFTERAHGDARAAVFAEEPSVLAAFRRKLFLPHPRQGLMLRKSVYEDLGGHRAEAADPEAALIRRIGRARLTTLRTPVSFPDI